MIKMKKLDNKGFVLAETLVVAVFLVAVFSIIYNNMYPLIGEYERREVYDDLDSKYAVYWLKSMVQDKDYNITKNVQGNNNILVNFDYSLAENEEFKFDRSNDKTIRAAANASADHGMHDTVVRFDCNSFVGSGAAQKKKMCEETLKRLEVSFADLDGVAATSEPEVYITAFRLDDFKAHVANYEEYFSSDFYEYLLYLPDFTKVRSTNLATARIIAKFHKTKDGNDYYTYSQIEVKK